MAIDQSKELIAAVWSPNSSSAIPLLSRVAVRTGCVVKILLKSARAPVAFFKSNKITPLMFRAYRLVGSPFSTWLAMSTIV